MRARVAGLGAVLALTTLAAFAPILANGFVEFDDDLYILNVPYIHGGLGLESLRFAFTTLHGANWMPLTWLSWALDVSLFGLDPRGFHATSGVLHAAGSVLLFAALARATEAPGRSFFVAAVFALHPLHVEPVAWASARKDVVSGLFFMLTLTAYVRYAERPAPLRYLAVAASMALGLLSKSVGMTLPVVLGLLDLWPLGRLRGLGAGAGRCPPRSVRALVLEKLPLLGLSVLSGLATFHAQRAGGAVQPFERLPFAERVANAVVSYAFYLAKAVWPADLAMFYPYSARRLALGAVLLAAAVLLAGTALALRGARRRPWLLVGWLWYVVTLVPMIGLVQVGAQSAADRYTYLPAVGIAIVVAFGVPELLAGLRGRRLVLTALTGLVVLAMAWGTRAQAILWRDSVTLFEHTLAVTEGNYVVHDLLGRTHLRAGRFASAAEQFRAAIRIHPRWASAHANLGLALEELGEVEAAREQYRRGLALAHESGDASLAVALRERLARHGEAASP